MNMPFEITRRHALQTAAAAVMMGLSVRSLLDTAVYAAVEPPTGAGYEARRTWMLEAFRNLPISHQPKPGMPQAVARLYLADGRDVEALQYVTESFDQLRTPEEKKGQTRNIAPALVRALHMFGKHFSSQQLQQIKHAVTSKVIVGTLRGHGTENHAAQFVTSMYLLAQFFPDATWESSDGKRYTSVEMMAEAKSRIMQRGKGFFRAGNNEQLSTTYATVNVYPLFNLMEFAQDPQVRDSAEALVLYHLTLLALNNFDGHIIPPFNRSNATQQRFGPPGKRIGRYMPFHHTHAWLFWGQNEVIAEDFSRAVEPALALDYVYAGWRMPEVLNRIARGADAPYEIRGTLPAFGSWGSGKSLETLRYVWRDRDFAIGGVAGQHVDPGQFLLDYDTFGIVWKSPNRFRSLQVMHPYWRSNEGEDYWKGTHSPFQQTGVYRNTAIVVFNIPEKDPWRNRAQQKAWLGLRNKHFDELFKLAEVRFPTTVEEFVQDGDFYFFREREVYVAVRVLKPKHTRHEIGDELLKKLDGNSDVFHVIKSREAQTGFVFEVGTAEKHKSFAAFQATVRSNPLTVDWSALEVRYQNSNGDQLQFRYETKISEDKDGYIWFAPDFWINGKKRDLSNWPITDSPLVSLCDGVLKVAQGGASFNVDWRGDYPRHSR